MLLKISVEFRYAEQITLRNWGMRLCVSERRLM
jgi:hypothetical protein